MINKRKIGSKVTSKNAIAGDWYRIWSSIVDDYVDREIVFVVDGFFCR